MPTLLIYCSLFTHCSFDTAKNKFDYYREKNCMKNVCLDLKERATKLINYGKKKMIPLRKKGKKIHREPKFVIYAKKDLVLMMAIQNTLK